MTKHYILIIGSHRFNVRRLIDCVALIRILKLPLPLTLRQFDCNLELSEIRFFNQEVKQ